MNINASSARDANGVFSGGAGAHLKILLVIESQRVDIGIYKSVVFRL